MLVWEEGARRPFTWKHKSTHAVFALLCCLLLCNADATSILIHGDRARKVLLSNGHADDAVSCSYRPESGIPSSSYKIVVKSSASDVLQIADVYVLPAIESVDRSVNTTLTVDFERAVGKTQLEIQVIRSDGSVYLTTSIQYIVVGISFFYTDKAGHRRLVEENTFSVTSYTELLESDFTALEVFICFPDGSTSSESSSSRHVTQVLQQTKVSSTDVAAILQGHSFDSCVAHISESGTLSQDCSFGFLRSPKLLFGLRFLHFRSGSVTIKFFSDSLLAGSEFEESYETYLSIIVGGTPPPAVISVEPSGGFRPSGGQVVKLAVANTQEGSTLSVHFDNSVDLKPFGRPEYLEASKTTVASFITAPGKERVVPYSVHVHTNGVSKSAVWAAEGKPFSFEYSAKSTVAIHKIEPSSGPLSGGYVVTLSGQFPEYDASPSSGDAIYVGKDAVAKSSIVSSSLTTIVFTMPAKLSSSSDEYDISVHLEIKREESNAIVFRYDSFSAMHIAVLGSSLDIESGIHRVSVCGESSNEEQSSSVILIPEPNVGAHSDEIRYQWILVEFETRKEVARSEGEWFKVSKSVMQDGAGYEAVVLAKEDSTGKVMESKVRLQASSSQFYGLALATSRQRTISQPLTDVRVTAMLFDDGPCFTTATGLNVSDDLVFEWKYGGEVYNFSQASTSFEEAAIGARRFGREFMIPRRLLQYGTHTVVCTASSGDLHSFAATAAVNISVLPSTPKAQIGSGQSFLQLSSDSNINLYASESTDVDAASLDPDTLPSGLVYEWRCEVSTSGGSLFDTFEVCPYDIVDPKDTGRAEIEIPKTAIDTLKTVGVSTFLRFSILVRKTVPGYGQISSSEVSQVLEISDNVEKSSVHRTKPESLSYGTGSASLPDLMSWRTDEALIIEPKESADIEWRFKLLQPESESFSFLLDPRHLLPYPGYVEASNLVAGRKALGITSSALAANTLYKFKIEFEAPSTAGKSGGYEEISVRTARKPGVTFSALSQTVGTTDTIFVVKARSSFVSTSYNVYFFVDLPGEGRICVDGCSGNDVAAFRLPRAGSYNISCAISDSRGVGEYQFAEGVHSVTVTSALHSSAGLLRSSSDAEFEHADLQTTLNQSLRQADHASFELNCISIARTATLNSDQNTNSYVGSLVRQALSRLDGLSTTTQPNTPLGRDYIKIALAFSALPTSSEVFGDTGTFQDACRLVQTAVRNTPASEAYRLDGELVAFLSNMANHANQHSSGGTNRRRLLQVSDDDSAESLHTTILDLAEMTTPALMLALSRDKPCGYQTSRVVDKVSNVSIAIRCNQEQGSQLKGRYATMHWCPDVFSKTGDSPRLFVLSEMNDYITSSNVLSHSTTLDSLDTEIIASGNESFARATLGSDSQVLVKTFVLKLADSSTAIGTATVHPADAELTGDSCFALNQTVKATDAAFTSRSDYKISCRSVDAIAYENVKELGRELPEEPYKEASVENSEKEFDSFDAGVQETSVFARLRIVNGLTFGARRRSCSSARPLLLGVSAVAGVTVGLLVAVISSTLILWMGLTYHIAQSTATSGAPILAGSPYIERDVYGRNTIGGPKVVRNDVVAAAVGGAEEDVVAFNSPHRTGRDTFSG